MKPTRMAAVCSVLVIAAVAGCQTNDKEADRIADDAIESVKELVAAMESVQDKETAKAAATRIEGVCDQLQALAAEAREIRVSPAKSKEIEDRFRRAMDSLESRVDSAETSAGASYQDEATFIRALERYARIDTQIEFARH